MNHARYLVFAALALGACDGGSVKDTLGLSKKAPDEFRVVSRPALSVPPQFNLRPPSISDVSPTHTPADRQAQSLVLGTPLNSQSGDTYSLEPPTDAAVMPVQAGPVGSAKPLGAATPGESQLLKNAGAAQADPRVRQQLTEEKNSIVTQEEESSWWDIMGSKQQKEPLVDAKGEANRIEQNKAQGKPVTEGETPETKGRDTGTLGRILGY
jgi:hypothetical protein